MLLGLYEDSLLIPPVGIFITKQLVSLSGRLGSHSGTHPLSILRLSDYFNVTSDPDPGRVLVRVHESALSIKLGISFSFAVFCRLHFPRTPRK